MTRMGNSLEVIRWLQISLHTYIDRLCLSVRTASLSSESNDRYYEQAWQIVNFGNRDGQSLNISPIYEIVTIQVPLDLSHAKASIGLRKPWSKFSASIGIKTRVGRRCRSKQEFEITTCKSGINHCSTPRKKLAQRLNIVFVRQARIQPAVAMDLW